jgi:toxin HigB-1
MSFADRQTEQLYVTGTSGRVPPDAIDAADQVELLRVPPGNRLHALVGDRAG